MEKLTPFSQGFNIDIFYQKLVRWIVVSNQPFSEIENEELRDLLLYLRPSLKGRIIGADQLTRKVQAMADKSRLNLKQYLAVSLI